jgi:iron complex transport system ATP-binding protein
MDSGGKNVNLSVDHVSVTLSRQKIVNKISLRVKTGQFVGLIGPNGCGKSTLLRSVYKALEPAEGRIMLDEHDVTRTRPKTVARWMAVVGQFSDIDFDFTAREIVMMGRTPYKGLLDADTEEDYRVADAALDLMNMLDFAERSYLSLSGGEKQRVFWRGPLRSNPGS